MKTLFIAVGVLGGIAGLALLNRRATAPAVPVAPSPAPGEPAPIVPPPSFKDPTLPGGPLTPPPTTGIAADVTMFPTVSYDSAAVKRIWTLPDRRLRVAELNKLLTVDCGTAIVHTRYLKSWGTYKVALMARDVVMLKPDGTTQLVPNVYIARGSDSLAPGRTGDLLLHLSGKLTLRGPLADIVAPGRYAVKALVQLEYGSTDPLDGRSVTLDLGTIEVGNITITG